MARTRQPWFRFYVEAVSDPKIRKLTPSHRWLWVAILCLARQSPEPGVLLISERSPHDLRSISDSSSLDVRTVRVGINALVQADMLTTTPEGYWQVRAWKDRQYDWDMSAERTSQWRHKDRHKPVTKTVTVTHQRTDTETDKNNISGSLTTTPAATRRVIILRAMANQTASNASNPAAYAAVVYKSLWAEHEHTPLDQLETLLNQPPPKPRRQDPPEAMRRDYDHTRPDCKTCNGSGWTNDGDSYWRRCDHQNVEHEPF